MSREVMSDAEAAMREDQVTAAYVPIAAKAKYAGAVRGLSGAALRGHVTQSVQAHSLKFHIQTVRDMAAKGRRPSDAFLAAAVAILDRAVVRAVDLAMTEAS